MKDKQYIKVYSKEMKSFSDEAFKCLYCGYVTEISTNSDKSLKEIKQHIKLSHEPKKDSLGNE